MPALHLAARDDAALTIETDGRAEPFYWRVTLRTRELTASTDIDLDYLHHHVGPIADYFAELAADWRGWTGDRSWGERPLALTATHDGLGRIALTVDLEHLHPTDNRWAVRATITLEAGQLDRAARDAAQLPPIT